jgi:hypothetical protein
MKTSVYTCDWCGIAEDDRTELRKWREVEGFQISSFILCKTVAHTHASHFCNECYVRLSDVFKIIIVS